MSTAVDISDASVARLTERVRALVIMLTEAERVPPPVGVRVAVSRTMEVSATGERQTLSLCLVSVNLTRAPSGHATWHAAIMRSYPLTAQGHGPTFDAAVEHAMDGLAADMRRFSASLTETHRAILGTGSHEQSP